MGSGLPAGCDDVDADVERVEGDGLDGRFVNEGFAGREGGGLNFDKDEGTFADPVGVPLFGRFGVFAWRDDRRGCGVDSWEGDAESDPP